MAASPDDRFAGLINSSAERGGWVPGDVFESDSEGEEESVEPRRVRLPILVALAVATIAVLVIAFLIFRPIPQHAASEEHLGSVEGSGTEPGDGVGTGPGDSVGTDSGDGVGTSAEKEGAQPGQGHAESDHAQAEDASAPQSTESGAVIVHVTGAVHRPSVVSLTAGARVQDAVEAAGGLKKLADAEAINLARVLHDGEQIHIPVAGEEPEPGRADSGSSASSAAEGEGSGTAAGGAAGASDGAAPAPDSDAKVDLNTADLTALQTLPGVGPVTAEAIIAHREEQPFGSVEDLLLVQGIGPKTFESLKDLVVVG